MWQKMSFRQCRVSRLRIVDEHRPLVSQWDRETFKPLITNSRLHITISGKQKGSWVAKYLLSTNSSFPSKLKKDEYWVPNIMDNSGCIQSIFPPMEWMTLSKWMALLATFEPFFSSHILYFYPYIIQQFSFPYLCKEKKEILIQTYWSLK